jgi:hypothetical protein
MWRTTEFDKPIDASGTMADGTRFSGPGELQQVLLARGDEFAATVADKLMTYALGRGAEYYDMPALRQILKRTKGDNYRWSSLVQAIVESTPFQMRRAPTAIDDRRPATGAAGHQ